MTPSRRDDERLLGALHMRDVAGMSYSDIAKCDGRAPNTICTQVKKVEAASNLPCACIKPENIDGGMPAGWWFA